MLERYDLSFLLKIKETILKAKDLLLACDGLSKLLLRDKQHGPEAAVYNQITGFRDEYCFAYLTFLTRAS